MTTRNGKKASVRIKVYDPYKPSIVALNVKGTQTLAVGDVMQLNAQLYPETATTTLKWKSSKKKVAKVDANGVVSALSPGKATITVTTRNKKKAKVKIKVVASGNRAVASSRTGTGSNKKADTASSGKGAGTGAGTIGGGQGVSGTGTVISDGYPPITTPADYSLPYVIYACKDSHTIAIIARDSNGAWNRVIRLLSTGTGRYNSTDVGVFTLTEKERWHMWSTDFALREQTLRWHLPAWADL